MKKLFLAAAVAAMALGVTACGGPEGDYESPSAVIEAHEALHPEWENSQLYSDLEGKTFVVKASQKLDKSDPLGDTEKERQNDGDDHDWLCIPYSDIETEVFLWLTDEEWEAIEYDKNDELLVKVEFIAQRGNSSGSLRQYYINATLAEQ